MKPATRPVLWWVVLLAAVLGVLLTAALGQWQWRRAALKQALVDQRTRQAAMAPIDGDFLGAASDTQSNRQGLLYRAVQVRGQWLPEHTVFLDNRPMHGQAGFYVLTPLRLPSGAVLLVQRGWVARNFSDRTSLPALPTAQGEVRLKGYLTPWPSRIYDFGGDEAGPIRQNLDFASYRRQIGESLLELSVQQSGDAQDGLLRDWPVPASGIEKHHGYAFQWFGLSALIAMLYVWFQIVQPRRKHPTR